MVTDETRQRAMDATRGRILDVARELLGTDPDAGIGDIAAAAGVVRRTVYGYFPARADLVRTLAGEAVREIEAVLDEIDADTVPADEVWTEFVRRLWPLADRYRVLLALRRGEQGDEIHELLGAVDGVLAAVITRGQDDGTFGRHLPAEVLGRTAYATLFAIADDRRNDAALDVRAATVTSLLVLGVAGERAGELADRSA